MTRWLNPRRLRGGGLGKGIVLLLLVTICVLLMLQLKTQMDAQSRVTSIQAAPAQRIFCIISCLAYRHEHAGIHVKKTWVNHCDHFLFVSDNVHTILEPAVFIHSHDKWQLMRAHLEYVYTNHFGQGDWFIYANDDNFVVVENVRHMLRSYSPDELIYFGCKLRNAKGQPFMYDKSSMVFSAASLKHFVLEALTNESLCSSKAKGAAAGEELGRCLSNVNVLAGDSRDEWQGHRFLPFALQEHLVDRLNESLKSHKYFMEHSYYPLINVSPILIIQRLSSLFCAIYSLQNNLAVSLRLISSHLVEMKRLYNLYYFTYNVRLFGVP
ncbi:hypothetical protein KR018_004480, partial [Drosophila ironensis]